MTITTEQLEARATAMGLDFFIEDRSGIPVKQWIPETNGCTPATCAEVAMWNLLAAREAVPVGFIERSGLDYLQSGADADICPDGGVGDIPLYTAPPETAYPENLPCPVRLMPGLLFGKGVRTRILLDALARRAKYEAELEAMTPEQKAEHDAAGELFKSMLPTPAPATGVDDDVRNILELLESGEWAEHCTKTAIGQRLEAEITRLIGRQAPAL